MACGHLGKRVKFSVKGAKMAVKQCAVVIKFQ
jgi:hypothetical protein